MDPKQETVGEMSTHKFTETLKELTDAIARIEAKREIERSERHKVNNQLSGTLLALGSRSASVDTSIENLRVELRDNFSILNESHKKVSDAVGDLTNRLVGDNKLMTKGLIEEFIEFKTSTKTAIAKVKLEGETNTKSINNVKLLVAGGWAVLIAIIGFIVWTQSTFSWPF